MSYDFKVTNPKEAFKLLEAVFDAIEEYNEAETTEVIDFVNVVATVNTGKAAIDNGSNNFVCASTINQAIAVQLLARYLFSMVSEIKDDEAKEDIVISTLGVVGVEISDEFVKKARAELDKVRTQVRSTNKH